MNQQPQQMTPEDQALARQAGETESQWVQGAMAQVLQQRMVELRMEVMRRDERIAELEQALASTQGGVPHSGDLAQ